MPANLPQRQDFSTAVKPLRRGFNPGRKFPLALAIVALLTAGVLGGGWFGLEQLLKNAERPRQLTEQTVLRELQAYVNSLGMKFVPVPGTGVLFSIWETRVKDYKVFVEATNREWPKPSFQQAEEHPAVNVSWEDATAFCEWLTAQERSAGRISVRQSYRLPSDEEWSVAVGLKEESGSILGARQMKVKGVYPWGRTWPPPKGAGNYDSSLKVDEFAQTSSAGSFAANENGIYDLGGNVWEWCEDWYDAERKYRVLRGASWNDLDPGTLLSSCRYYTTPVNRGDFGGFRCVLVVESSR